MLPYRLLLPTTGEIVHQGLMPPWLRNCEPVVIVWGSRIFTRDITRVSAAHIDYVEAFTWYAVDAHAAMVPPEMSEQFRSAQRAMEILKPANRPTGERIDPSEDDTVKVPTVADPNGVQ